MKLGELIELLENVEFHKKMIVDKHSERFEGSYNNIYQAMEKNKQRIENWEHSLKTLLEKEIN